MRQTTSQIAYLLTANLRDPTKPKILPTFDTQHPVNSTPTMALTYPKKYKDDINLKTQNRDINPTTAKQQDLNGFLLHYIVYYKDSKYNNIMLQYYIREDFVRQTKKTQTPVKKDIV